MWRRTAAMVSALKVFKPAFRSLLLRPLESARSSEARSQTPTMDNLRCAAASIAGVHVGLDFQSTSQRRRPCSKSWPSRPQTASSFRKFGTLSFSVPRLSTFARWRSKSLRKAATRLATLSMPTFANFRSAARRSAGPQPGCEAHSTSHKSRRSRSSGTSCGAGSPTRLSVASSLPKSNMSGSLGSSHELSGFSCFIGVPISKEGAEHLCESLGGVIVASKWRPETALDSSGALLAREAQEGCRLRAWTEASLGCRGVLAISTWAAGPRGKDQALEPPHSWSVSTSVSPRPSSSESPRSSISALLSSARSPSSSASSSSSLSTASSEGTKSEALRLAGEL
mmetsp:Transcript_71668/g.213906  ORF Transcript_71668/g.213906 Transcript_71668/m.213906 type:complete len:340 (+) Transcript_71668:1988-3007(+)